MSYLIINRERFALRPGENVVGGSGENAVMVEALRSMPPAAVITVVPGAAATIARVGDARVLLDAVPVDGTPRALQHGARLEIGALRVSYGEMGLIGSTSPANGTPPNNEPGLANFGIQPNEQTADTGGRVTDLQRRARHDVPPEGLSIGRDPSCHIVLGSREVSRQHALISTSLLGYMLHDRSTNGVAINGVRVQGAQLLRQRDVIRIADAEFLFEADPTTLEPALESTSMPAAYATGEVETPAEEPRKSALLEPPTAERTPAKVLLATIEVLNQGPMRGMRLRIERTAVQIGRGAHSDLRIPDESVSASHASLIQVGPSWHLLDLGSKNGTYVDGKRIATETVLPGAVELRFGNIKVLFRPIARGTQDVKSTKHIVG